MKVAFSEDMRRTETTISRSKGGAVFDNCFEPAWDDLLEVVPATGLSMIHDPAYVEGVLDRRLVDGFGERSEENIKQILMSNGAMVAAAKAAEEYGVAFSPVSGFHHAHYDYNWGYCTFNGLVLAAMQAAAKTILIIDGDGHRGDGTDSCLETLRPRLLLREKLIVNLTHDGGGLGVTGEGSRSAISRALHERKWGLVLYQAGADAHADDPYGAGYLSDAEWRKRDTLVFSLCKELGIPVAWNLAGGYNGVKTINLHTDTFHTACSIYEPTRPLQRLAHPSGGSSRAPEAADRLPA